MAFVVLPTQLCNYPKSFWAQWDRVLVIEDAYYINSNQHPLKLWMYRASMREYFTKIPVKNKKYFEHTTQPTMPARFTMCHPIDGPMTKKYKRGTFTDPPNFILRIDELPAMDTPVQSVFYKRMRLKLNLLMENGKPLGGKWSFDSDNRWKYPVKYVDTPLNRGNPIGKEITKISKIELKLDHLPWPTNRTGALKRLREFVKNKLAEFGPYQDAIREDVLLGSHSGISASMNIGLITPADVLHYVSKSDAPLQSKEALIRQIIGWREFIRMRYLLHGLTGWDHLKNMNQKIGKEWYNATTGLLSLDWSINRVLTYAYVPHIERLMLLLNYATLMQFKYEDVRNWFINCFIDANGEWQMLNIEMGMSSLSKNRFMTRAYLNSGKYLIGQGLKVEKSELEHMRRLYESFVKANAKLARRDYRLASAAKRLDTKKSYRE